MAREKNSPATDTSTPTGYETELWSMPMLCAVPWVPPEARWMHLKVSVAEKGEKPR